MTNSAPWFHQHMTVTSLTLSYQESCTRLYTVLSAGDPFPVRCQCLLPIRTGTLSPAPLLFVMKFCILNYSISRENVNILCQKNVKDLPIFFGELQLYCRYFNCFAKYSTKMPVFNHIKWGKYAKGFFCPRNGKLADGIKAPSISGFDVL